jgi:hypothetical protein
MSRKPNDQTFRLTDFYRLDDAARARGLSIAAFEATRTPDGKRTVKVIFGEPAKDGGADNALDQWMVTRADQTEGH